MLCQSHDPILGIWSDFVKKVLIPPFWVYVSLGIWACSSDFGSDIGSNFGSDVQQLVHTLRPYLLHYVGTYLPIFRALCHNDQA